MENEQKRNDEPVKPIAAQDHDTPDPTWWFVCPRCRIAIDYGDRYCRHCGIAFSWESWE